MSNFKRIISIIFLIAISAVAFLLFIKDKDIARVSENKIQDKVYVASEESGEITVVSVKDRVVMDRISLSSETRGIKTVLYPHNVQVAPNNKSVWVTANAYLMNMKKNTDMAGMSMDINCEIIVIDPLTDKIIKRMEMGAGLHLSHIVLTPDSNYAIAVAQSGGAIFKINANTYEIEKEIFIEKGSEPHGLRISPDGKTAYIAIMEGKSLGILDIDQMSLTYVPLKGKAVQSGVTPDGKYALASIYYPPSLAVYEISSAKLSYVDLPPRSLGMVQIYPTPNSQFVFVADQGYFFNQFAGEYVYKIDLKEMSIAQTIKAGSAPHGVVVSNDGKLVFVTNMLSNNLSVIDADSGKEIARIKVGRMPNGVSIFYSGGVSE